MKKDNIRHKRKKFSKEERIGKIHYRIYLFLMILNVVHYLFWEPRTLGHDNRYTYYIILLPTILGIFILGIYSRVAWRHIFKDSDKIIVKIPTTVLFLIMGFFLSYLSFGFVSKVTWNYFNKMEAMKNPSEVITCKIDGFYTGRRSSVNFKYNNRFAKFRVSYRYIKDYIGKNPSDFKLEITARKGLWDYYLVDDWEIKAVKSNY